MDAKELLSHAITFAFGNREGGFSNYYVRLRNSGECSEYAVTDGFNSCWHKGLQKFVDEPFPHEQDEEFKRNTSIPLDVAVEIVEKLLAECENEHKCNGE
jgi:hypothetical protein